MCFALCVSVFRQLQVTGNHVGYWVFSILTEKDVLYLFMNKLLCLAQLFSAELH